MILRASEVECGGPVWGLSDLECVMAESPQLLGHEASIPVTSGTPSLMREIKLVMFY